MDSGVQGPRAETMETRSGSGSGRGLARLIRELQGEIKKLERENRALRGQLGRPGPGSGPQGEPELQNPEENSTHLRRNVSAPALEGQYRAENIIMTVRRYSISSSSLSVPQESADRGSPTQTDGTIATETLPRHSLQQHVNQTRAKVKTVTFLLPVEDIYTNRPVLAHHVPDRNSQDLSAIVETDS